MYWIIVRDEVSWHSTRLQMSFNLILLLCGLLYHPFLHTLTSVVVSLSTLHAWVTHLWLQFWFIFLTVFILFFFSNYAAICRCRLLDIYFKPLTHSMQGVDGQCLSGHVLACKLLVVQLCPCMGVCFFFFMPSGGSALPRLMNWLLSSKALQYKTQVQRLRKIKHFRVCSTWAILLSAAPHTLSLFWVLVKTTVKNYLVCSLWIIGLGLCCLFL